MNFSEQFVRQLRFLDASCQLYDLGQSDEAIRIAVSLRVLFHDTKASKSLVMTHLGKKNLEMLSTCYGGKDGKLHPFGLTDIKIKPMVGGEFVPRLKRTKVARNIPFHRWWRRDVVFSFKDPAIQISRRDLVLAAANRDGGAHVDEKYDSKYQRLVDGADWAMIINPDNGDEYEVRFRNASNAALRQIAFEVLCTQAIKDLLEESNDSSPV